MLLKGQRVYHKVLGEWGTATGEYHHEISPLVHWDDSPFDGPGIGNMTISTDETQLVVFPSNATPEQIQVVLSIVTSQ